MNNKQKKINLHAAQPKNPLNKSRYVKKKVNWKKKEREI